MRHGINVAAGLREMEACGIEYTLQRWARGEEELAQKTAIAQDLHGVLRILAAARAAAEET